MVQETGVQYQVESYQRLKKWYLMPPYLALSTIRYVSRLSRTIQGIELQPPLHLGVVAIEKGAFVSLPTKVANFTFFLYIDKKLIIAYIYVCVYIYIYINM